MSEIVRIDFFWGSYRMSSTLYSVLHIFGQRLKGENLLDHMDTRFVQWKEIFPQIGDEIDDEAKKSHYTVFSQTFP